MRIRIGLLAGAVFAVGNASSDYAHCQATTNSSTSPSAVVPLPQPLPPPPLLPPPPKAVSAPATRPSAATPFASTRPTATTSQLGKVVVRSNLDVNRDQIAPSLGATTYTIGPEQIETTPQGDNAPFQQVLLRMPGVVEDSFGQEHVRGEHANLTYRVDGVLLPEPLNGFGQELDTHLIENVTLIDGSLPAQFGFHTAGIVDVTSKSGDLLNNNEISLYGGSYNTFQSSAEFGGTRGKWDYFVTGTYKSDSLGIENPTGGRTAIHDDTEQSKLFTYLSYHIDDTSRLSVLLNASYADFQIPNTPGLPQAFALSGVPSAESAAIDENQNEQDYYGVVSYQKSIDKFSMQASVFYRYGDIHFVPDHDRDLIFQGVASDVQNPFTTSGLQFDSSYILNDQHTVRTGLLGDYTAEKNDTNTAVFPVDPITGLPTSTVPIDIVDNTRNHATEAGVYLQDEWRLSKVLTLNYGLRYDRFDSNFDNEDQISPRANLVWKATDTTTAHIGYARYFVPPPVQYVPPGTLAKFTDTTNAPNNFLDGPPKVERSNYFDAGVSQQINKSWQVNLDGFYKQAHNLVDLGQFGSAVILSPFNYRTGTVYGSELSSTYKMDPWTLFGNFSWVQTAARDIDSQQFLIDNSELAYIADHDIRLDHESQYTVSAGASYDITKNDLVYVDVLYGSGLRSGFANTQKQPYYIPVNIGYQHVFRTNSPHGDVVKFRCDVINLFDQAYELRDGSGIGVAAPQWGQRRSLYVGLAYDF